MCDNVEREGMEMHSRQFRLNTQTQRDNVQMITIASLQTRSYNCPLIYKDIMDTDSESSRRLFADERGIITDFPPYVFSNQNSVSQTFAVSASP